ncbi:MAG: class I SAM-dependent methyltransferase [Pseudomonadota bacterium]
MTIKVDPEWWKTLFDEVYLLTDARSVCDHELTGREVDVICDLLPIRTEDRILDLCGGHGRHSFALCGRGYKNCTVLDYSSYLINRGKECASNSGHFIGFVQGDVRSMGFGSDAFHHVLIMGNSLGYILDPDADRSILTEAYRILRRRGWLLIDVADGASARAHFNPSAWHEIGPDIVVCREREMNGDTIRSREVVISKTRGLIHDRTYSIRLYDPETLAALTGGASFTEIKIHTEFAPRKDGGDHGFMNHRMILTAQKP